MRTIIYCGTLITPFESLDDHSIVIETGMISDITPRKVEPAERDVTINASNRIVTPGLIDVHMHGVPDGNYRKKLALSCSYKI